MLMRLKKMKLATKLALIIGVLLVVVFSVLIVFTVSTTQSTVRTTIEAEFSAMAKATGLQVQQIVDTATTAAQNLQDYLSSTYARVGEVNAVAGATQAAQTPEEAPSAEAPPPVEEPPAEGEEELPAEGEEELPAEGEEELPAEETPAPAPAPAEEIQGGGPSKIYDVELSALGYEAENYILSSTWSTVKNSPDIVGMGVFFEPHRFDPAVEDYSVYINDQAAVDRTASSYGAYETYSNEGYYSVAANTKQTYFTSPYFDEGVTMISGAFPAMYNNVLLGVIAADIDVQNFSKAYEPSTEYPSMYASIFNEDGIIVFDSLDADKVGHNTSEYIKHAEELAAVMENFKTGEAFSIETTRPDGSKLSRFYYPIVTGNTHWWAMTALDRTDMMESVTTITFWLLLISIISLLAIVIVSTVVLRRVLAPIGGVVSAADSIARGQFDINLHSDSADEIGVLSNTFSNTAQNLKDIIADVGYLLGEMAGGNFRIKTQNEEKYVGDYASILKSMRGINRRLSGTLSRINQAANQVTSGSEQVSSGAQALSQGATEQASSIEELSATVTEISDQVRSNAEGAQEARREASDAADQVERSNRQMQEMMRAMEQISGKSSEISKIIKTIEDIAFQTNILALNAAVEAARAGAAGKGFAVVADEVRNLASKSAEAAKNTTDLIGETVSAVDNGTELASETAQSMLAVVDGVRKVTALIDQIANASNNQATAITQVTQGMDQISSVVQTNSATAEESAAASEELSGQAQMLNDLVGQFTLNEESETAAGMSAGPAEGRFTPPAVTGSSKY